MFVTLKNDQLEVTINSLGAEIWSIKHDGLERLWQGDPNVWAHRAPNLFPFIGRLINDQYDLNGTTITGRMHGLVNDREFEVEQESDTCVRFVTASDEWTRERHPFDWRLTIQVKLEGNVIVKSHTVENLTDGELLYEMGGHEAYATCLYEGETMDDYYVQFQDMDAMEYFTMDEKGILGVPKHVMPLEQGRLFTTPEQAQIDTYVLENVPGNAVELKSTKNDRSVRVEFSGFPFLGMWTIAGHSPRYLCIEPWTTLPDAHFVSRELGERPGIRKLAAGETETTTYTMTFA